MTKQQSLLKQFNTAYAKDAEVVAYAPGRVNLIGDHTDYNDGFVLPAAVNFGTHVLAAKREDDVINVTAIDIDNQRVSFNLSQIAFDDKNTWSNYVRGTIIELVKFIQSSQPNTTIAGVDLLISGNVPQGAGLSSSAAFEIALLKALSDLFDIPLPGIDAAKLGQKAENNFVGCQCGIMDQLISALGKKSHAMLLDCRDLSYQFAKIPENMALMIVNSNVKRELVSSEYNTRRAQCEAVAKHFNRSALRDVSLAELNEEKHNLAEELYKRAHHVISESERTLEALTALNTNNMARLSYLMAQSHRSLKDDFEVTTPELDYLVEILSRVVKEEGGVRMTGGGFGGCVVAILPKAIQTQAEQVVQEYYVKKTGIEPSIFICTAEHGAFSL
ncbi:galactokinase [Litorilituus lipolyticus]|uniref:Galactokinase n=1 Tax=Litorilituus lipolyticus TaxID=2491017 RepID=A0A502KV45_9GAMM|nr:galactokinase [Litorilituus lipolyticus]TPH13891.1 galactokinase [Litorilituus lipolyticus]